jgi:two-component system, NarL family, nitrate/nitrite response regulator NarL
MIKVSLIGFDGAARSEVQRILERAGIVIVDEGDSPSDVAVVHVNGASEDQASVESLKSREGDVLELLAEGLSNRRVAERLGISEHTVKFHVASIYGKLGASSRAELIRRAARRGLITI